MIPLLLCPSIRTLNRLTSFAVVNVTAQSGVHDLIQNLNSLVKELQSTIIMPAGDVFMFSGIDLDTTGNLYSHVSYANAAEGSERVVR